MLRMLHDIQGMQVIALNEGRVMGAVQKVFINPTRKSVSGVLVRQGGLGGQESWVDIRDVSKVGEDVLFVERAANCKTKGPVGRSLKELMGMPVASKDGRMLGSLVDVEIDDNWRVSELSLSEGRLIEIDPQHAVFGQDTILLKAGATERIHTTPRHKVGFLARMFGSQAIEEAAEAISRAERASPKPKVAKASKPAKKRTRKKT